MSFLVVVLTTCLLGTAVESLSFDEYAKRYRKHYKDEVERAKRMAIYEESLEEIERHNAKPDISWTMGINQFSDWTWDEFKETMLMESQNCSATKERTKNAQMLLKEAGDLSVSDLPDAIDWRERGIVSEVKNQGSCGSCYAFSSVAALESHLALKQDNWRSPHISEQQIIDCAQAFDTNGCSGGLPSHVFQYIKYNGGIMTEFSYPYVGKDQNCSFVYSEGPYPQANGIATTVPGGSVNLTAGDEMALKVALATKGPVSVAYQVASDFKSYQSGIYNSTICESGFDTVNHAVLAVGYGTNEKGEQYYIIKNSWDYSFGMNGYFYIEAFVNMCGIADCNAYPDLYGEDQSASLF